VRTRPREVVCIGGEERAVVVFGGTPSAPGVVAQHGPSFAGEELGCSAVAFVFREVVIRLRAFT